MKRLIVLFLVAFAVSASLRAYDIIRHDDGGVITWNNGTIPMQIKMAMTPTLIDGSNFATSIQAAMAQWNAVMTRVQFTGEIVTPGTGVDDNGLNEIYFDSTIYGAEFGENTLAVTTSWRGQRQDGTYVRTQSDIIFNTKWEWNSYAGPLQAPEDIRRVAVHELGHVLGLTHPDENGQTVAAIMNSHASDTDSLEQDDLDGVHYLYGKPGPATPPANDSFANAIAIGLSNNAATVFGSSTNATKEVDEPDHAGEPAAASVWWKWTAPSSGSLLATTEGTNFDTILGVYTGNSIGALTQIASNDDQSNPPNHIRTSQVSVGTVASGITYYFAVDGWSKETGSIKLGVVFTPALVQQPPTISIQPADRTVSAGLSAVFTVTVFSNVSLTYQWQRLASGTLQWVSLSDGSNIFGSQTGRLEINAVTPTQSGDQFRCLVTNVAGSTTSHAAILTVTPANAITREPEDITVHPGARAYLLCEFNGIADVRWFRGGEQVKWDQNIGGRSFLSLNPAQLDHAGSYKALVFFPNGGGVITSRTAIVNITSDAPPFIVEHPSALSISVGSGFTLSVVADSVTTPSYQWRRDRVNIAGANGATYTKAVASAADGGTYTVVVSNGFGSVISQPTSLVVPLAPVVLTAPLSVNLSWGSTAQLSVIAAGTGPLTYQWRKDNEIIANANSATLDLGAASLGDEGSYSVTVANPYGLIESGSATVRVDDWVVGDLNGDGITDTAWGAPIHNQRGIWWTNNSRVDGAATIFGATGARRMMAAGDFNGDEKADILEEDTLTGERKILLMNGANVLQEVSLGFLDVAWSFAAVADFNADGMADIILQNVDTGQRTLWFMNGTVVALGLDLGGMTPEWHIAGAADFNGDSKTDILLENRRTGQRIIWFTHQGIVVGAADLGIESPIWRFAAIADFDGDDDPDILVENRTTGERVVWIMNGAVRSSINTLAKTNPRWRIVAAADFRGDGEFGLIWQADQPGPMPDFNRDGKPDLILENRATGRREIWLMDGTNVSATINLGFLDAGWHFVGAADFSADGNTDILLENPSTGQRTLWLMEGTAVVNGIDLGFLDASWHIAGVADFDTDGHPDILLENTVTGQRTLWLMYYQYVIQGIDLGNLNKAWRFKGLADFDRDGDVDILLENSNTGQRTLWLMTSLYVTSGIDMGGLDPAWKFAGVADFNRDGYPDIILENSSSGARTVWTMNGSIVTEATSLGTLSTDWHIAN